MILAENTCYIKIKLRKYGKLLSVFSYLLYNIKCNIQDLIYFYEKALFFKICFIPFYFIAILFLL